MNDHNGKISILVVDDTEANLVAIEAVLDDLNLNIVRARTGRDALRRLLDQDFAAILLDVDMPGMDGFETASLLRQRKKSERTPILFITAHSDEPYVSRAYELGAVDYIPTPIIPQVLRSKVAVFVELHRKTLEIQQQAEKLRQRANQLAALAAELTQAEQRERRHLAQVLHDNLQQLLVAARMRLGAHLRNPRGFDASAISQVDDLLGKSISVSRSLTLQLSPPILYDVGLVAAIGWLARQMKEHHGLTVDVQTDNSTEFAVENLRVFTFHAVRELLFNIVKHAGVNEARIVIARCPNNHIEIVVSDSGVGFDPAIIESRNARAEHFGLFSISERVRLMSGSLRIESASSLGTRITLQLPDRTEREECSDSSGLDMPVEVDLSLRQSLPSTKASPNGFKIQVVLVDDHETMRKGLSALLQTEPDMEVIGEAMNGPTAIELAQRLRPDVIVMDVSMPGMSGVEATRLIHQQFPDIRIIGLSMHHQEDLAIAMRRAGASAYLTKGGPPEALIAEIRGAGEFMPIKLVPALSEEQTVISPISG